VKAAVSWSGGKDSALALYHLLQDNTYSLHSLFTIVDAGSCRINIHGVHESLIDEQAKSIGLPLHKIYQQNKSNTSFESLMGEHLSRLKDEGVTHIVFGDIFLRDLRSYRERLLEKYGLSGLFPLWNKETKHLLDDFFSLGFEAYCCASQSESITGDPITASFISKLPPGSDPCGENGEYHCFCTNGPIFRYPIDITAGKPFPVIASLGNENLYHYWQSNLSLQTSNVN